VGDIGQWVITHPTKFPVDTAAGLESGFENFCLVRKKETDQRHSGWQGWKFPGDHKPCLPLLQPTALLLRGAHKTLCYFVIHLLKEENHYSYLGG
jgi:hypothetical protein